MTSLPSFLYASISGIKGDPAYPTRLTRNPPCNKRAKVGWVVAYIGPSWRATKQSTTQTTAPRDLIHSLPTVLHRDSAWYCILGLLPASPSTTTHALWGSAHGFDRNRWSLFDLFPMILNLYRFVVIKQFNDYLIYCLVVSKQDGLFFTCLCTGTTFSPWVLQFLLRSSLPIFSNFD